MEYIEVGTYLHNVLVCDDYVDVEKGNWFDITGFLGLQFLINGETHYGWAAVSVVFVDSKIPWTLSATLTGYAYETVADQPIVAGQISGP